MDYRRISVGLDDGVATIVIKRPEVMNALDDVTLNELQQVMQEFATDESVSYTHLPLPTNREV